MFRELRREISEGWAEIREEWAGLARAIREDRRVTKLGNQLITGKDNAGRREVRRAARAVTREARELERIARRVIAEHRRDR